MKKVDIICSLFLISVGIVFCIGAMGVGIGNVVQPGPGFMPFGASVLLIFFSLGTVGEALFAASSESVSPLGKRWGTVIVVMIVLFAYACFLGSLGFLLATFILLTVLYKLSEGQTWKVALIESALTTAFTFLLFDYLLRVPFPRGILEFTGL